MRLHLKFLKWWYERKITDIFDPALSLKLDGIIKRLEEWKH